MATASQLCQIPLPTPLRTSSNLATDWKRFKGQWTNYVKASKIDREEPECQAAILLACIGSDAYEIFTTLEFSEESDKQDPTKLLEAFDKYCIGEINEVYERYVFHRRHQEPGEQFDVFLSDLRRLVKSCAYGTVEDSTIRDRIVLGIRDDATRKKLLQTRTLNLAKAIDICRSAEVAHRQLKDITTPDEVQVLRQQPRAHWQRSPSRPRYDQSHILGLLDLSDRRALIDVSQLNAAVIIATESMNRQSTSVQRMDMRVNSVEKRITGPSFVDQSQQTTYVSCTRTPL